MEAGNDVILSVKTGKFNNDKNTTYGFYQLFTAIPPSATA